MAGLTVHPAQRRDARELLDDALTVAASGWPLAKREGYRDWLTTPSETLRVVLGQAGEDAEHWHRHRVPQLRTQWHAYPGPSG